MNTNPRLFLILFIALATLSCGKTTADSGVFNSGTVVENPQNSPAVQIFHTDYYIVDGKDNKPITTNTPCSAAIIQLKEDKETTTIAVLTAAHCTRAMIFYIEDNKVVKSGAMFPPTYEHLKIKFDNVDYTAKSALAHPKYIESMQAISQIGEKQLKLNIEAVTLIDAAYDNKYISIDSHAMAKQGSLSEKDEINWQTKDIKSYKKAQESLIKLNELETLKNKYATTAMSLDVAIIFFSIPASVKIPTPFKTATKAPVKNESVKFIGYGSTVAPGEKREDLEKEASVLRMCEFKVADTSQGRIETQKDTKVFISGGDSGGPLLNSNNEVVGVASGAKIGEFFSSYVNLNESINKDFLTKALKSEF